MNILSNNAFQLVKTSMSLNHQRKSVKKLPTTATLKNKAATAKM
jgi:hypothetical protein